MDLRQHFQKDDGSLPEIEVIFAETAQVRSAIKRFFDLGAADVSVGSAVSDRLQRHHSPSTRTFAEIDNLLSERSAAIHLVLGSLRVGPTLLPDLGVYVLPDGLVIDYRMGSHWGEAEIYAFFSVLRELESMGGSIRLPWWGSKVEQLFKEHLSET